MNLDSISVLIITKNRYQSLQKTVLSLKEQEVQANEVIIVDSSNNINLDEINKLRKNISIKYTQTRNSGYAAQRELALKKSKGDIVTFLDDDVIVPSDWIKKIALSHQKNKKVTAIQGSVIFTPKNNIISEVSQYFFQRWIEGNKIDSKHLSTISTVNVSLKKNHLVKNNIHFDNNSFYNKYSGEDTMLGYFITSKHLGILFDPQIIVYSQSRIGIINYLKQRFRKGISSQILNYQWILIHRYRDKVATQSQSFFTSRLKTRTLLLPASKISFILGSSYANIFMKDKDKVLLKNFFGKESNNNITVAIVTRNRSSSLFRLLKSLINQTILPKEIIVIDNDSTDKTQDTIKYFFPLLKIRYFREETIGIPYARNRALKECQTKYLAFLDDDCEATTTWVEEIIKAHQSYPGASAIQGYTLYKPVESVFSKISQDSYGYWLEKNRFKTNQLLVLDTKNISFKMSYLRKLNVVFNTTFLRGSDTNLAKQLISKKQKIIYCRQIAAIHWTRKTYWSFFKQIAYQANTAVQIDNKWPSIHMVDPFTEFNLNQKLRFQNAQINNRGWYYKIMRSLSLWLFQILHKQGNFKQSISFFPVTLKKENNITIALINFKSDKNIRDSLFSLIRQTVLPKEILIISNKNPEKLITEFKQFLPIRYFYQLDFGNSHAKAKNQAVKECQTKYLAFLDNECEATTTWVEEIVKAHKTYPNAAAIQGYTYFFWNLFEYNKEILQLLRDQKIAVFKESNNQISILDTSNFSLDISKTKKILFNESYKYIGELDYAVRLKTEGKKIYFCQPILAKSTTQKTLLDLCFFYYKISLEINRLIRKDKVFALNNSAVNKKLLIYISILLNPKSYNYLRDLSKTVCVRIFISLLKLGLIIQGKNSFDEVKKSLQFGNIELNEIIKNPLLTVGIVTRNRNVFLRKLLQSLTNQSIQPTQTLIIDNGSTDQTNDVTEEFKNIMHIKYIYEPQIGIPFARNRALKECKTKLLIFLDDDCEVPPNWLANLLVAQQNYPNAAAIQGQSFSLSPNNIFSTLTQYDRHNWQIWNTVGDSQKYWNSIIGLKIKPFKYKTIDTRNVLLNMEIIKKLGISFDTKINHGEDTDFGKQLIAQKQSIIFYPKAVAFHHEVTDFLNFSKKTLFRGTVWSKIKKKWPAAYKSASQKSLLKLFSDLYQFSDYLKNQKKTSVMPQLLGLYVYYNFLLLVGENLENLRPAR